MSLKRDVFTDSFSSDFNPRQRRSEILKKFDDLSKRQTPSMFCERPLGWASAPFGRSMENDCSSMANNDANEIPITVIHEKDLNKSSGFVSSDSNKINGKFETKIEPRVHHIPIKVEPRDEPLSRSSSSSSQRSGGSGGGQMNGPSSHLSSSRDSSPAVKEHIIPINVEGAGKPDPKGSEPPSAPLAANPSRMKSATPLPGQVQSSKRNVPPKNAPGTSHVTRVQVNQSKDPEDTSPSGYPQQPEPPQPKPDPLEIVQRIAEEVASLQKQVEAFTGEYQDKTYLFLDEMLTRCLLRLDNIEVQGRDDVRQARKSTISFINKCINSLEAKAMKNKMITGVQNEEPQNSEVSTDVEMSNGESEESETKEVSKENGEATGEVGGNEPRESASVPELEVNKSKSGVENCEEKMAVEMNPSAEKEETESENKSISEG